MNNTENFCKSYFYGNNSEQIALLNSNKFDIPESKLQFVPDHLVEPEHVKIEVEFYFDKELVIGTTTFNVVVKALSINQITLDAKNLEIHEIFVDDFKVTFDNTGKKIHIFLPREVPRGIKMQLRISHSVEKPTAGVYFVKPSNEYPNKHPHLWTQCQDEDASFFIPCFDHPSFKQTSEVIVKNIPNGMMALSNGTLLEKGDSFYHYKFDVPHSIYLLSIVVGQFQEVKDSWNGIPVSFYVHPSRIEDGHRAFDKTKKMIQFFSEFTGVLYPYQKYSQIAVSDFIFGGMENTTVTTQTDHTLHDERAHVDFSSDGLVAHELAHQWFGDLLTCKEWAHAWLNESFATYFQALFFEYDLGKDEFEYEMMTKAETYFNEDSNKYRRSIVYHKYSEPIDLFDAHLYPGGAWRLHMLRQMFGTEEFKRAINHYVEQNKYKNVETIDLQRAFEITTGKNVDSFFDQWIYKAGYPKIEFEYTWEKNKYLKCTVLQVQDIETSQLFKFDTKIKVLLNDKTEKIIDISITEKEQSFFIYLDEKPIYVSFDFQNDILKKLLIKTKPLFLKNQISYDDTVMGRIFAIQALAKDANSQSIKFLGSYIKEEKFWGVQAQIANALGTIGGSLAEEYLLDSLTLSHPKARREVVSALKNFPKSTKSITALKNILNNSEKSYYVEAEACKSLGLLKDESVFETLKNQLEKESHNDIIRQEVFAGLTSIHTNDSYKTLLEWTKIGKSIQARTSAITSLATLGKLINPEITFEHLVYLSQENNFRIKMAVINAFQIIANKKALAYLSKYHEREADGRMKKAAYKAKLAIQAELEKPQELETLKEEIGKLREENKQIKESISKLESK